MMNKTADALRTIGEVGELLNLPTHVLRFWEKKFPQIKPIKKANGRRYYRSEDVNILKTVKHLLHVERFTIEGAQKFLKEGLHRDTNKEANQPNTPPPTQAQNTQATAPTEKALPNQLNIEIMQEIEAIRHLITHALSHTEQMK